METQNFNSYDLETVIKDIVNALPNKTDRYWLDQVELKLTENSDLNIIVGSDFVKHSIEKKVFDVIKNIFGNYSSGDCIFILDKNFTAKSFYVKEPERVVTPNVDQVKKIELYDLSHFESLYVGSCNNLAVTAAKNIVVAPGSRFNPLFIYGKPGVGKTYLLKTIEKSYTSSLYVDSESFLESFVSGIKNGDVENFKNRIRSVDILLIDDIQFFLGKKGVSEELFHTINYFLNNSKSVVLASDQKPQDLIGFPERLVSRILNGLVTDIEKPDKNILSEMLKKTNLEHGSMLLTKKEEGLLLSLDFQSFREVNGVINNLIINKQTGLGNSKYVAELVSMYTENKVLELTPEFILGYASGVYQVDEKLVLSKNRSEQVSNARHLFIYLMRKHTGYSLNQIGLYAGNRSHSTVLSSIKKVEESPNLKREINIFNNKVLYLNSALTGV